MPSIVRLMCQLKSVLKKRETMLKNSKIVLFLSPYKVGQAGKFWTLLRIIKIVQLLHLAISVFSPSKC